MVMETTRMPTAQSVGIVAIGKNEGKRLITALASAIATRCFVVYVDSGSSDDSVNAASKIGARVVELDTKNQKFTAARARNAGLKELIEKNPNIEFVQFIDGDCDLQPGWIERAIETLQQDKTLAVVCGRRREKFPNASVYNRLCDIEWDTPVGPADACGGDAMFRRTMLEEVGGYDASLIAGEEPELCRRLAAKGFGILRIDAEMTHHDADITSFSQWWKRNVRAGHAFAQVSRKCMTDRGESFWIKNVRSNYIWAFPPLWLFWPVQWLRMYIKKRDADYASHLIVSKVPQAIGQLKYNWNRLVGKESRLIEYKGDVAG